MQKWEYLFKQHHEMGSGGGGSAKHEAYANSLGAEGWELIAVIFTESYIHTFIFKRPKS